MELATIVVNLSHEDFQYRLKALNCLGSYPIEVPLPLLLNMVNDREFLVQSPRGQDNLALLNSLKDDPNDRIRGRVREALTYFIDSQL